MNKNNNIMSDDRNKIISKKVSSSAVNSNHVKTSIEKGSVRQKLTKNNINLQELERLNEENIKSYSFREKRNQVIIIALSVLLILTIATIVVYLNLTKVEANCFLYTYGDVDAVYVVDGNETSSFRAPANIRGDCIFNIKVDIKINSFDDYNIKFAVYCYQNDTLLTNVVVYEPNIENVGFTYKSDGYYHSKSVISGGQTVRLCQGIALNEQEIDVNDGNFKFEIHTYFEKV